MSEDDAVPLAVSTPRRLTPAEIVAIRGREDLAPSLDRAQLLAHADALEAELRLLRWIAEAAREYLATDGSGVGIDDPAWRGVFDLYASWDAREQLRGYLTLHAALEAGEP